MALDLTALRAELVARGFDYLSQTRQDRFLNDALHAIDDLEPWSYLQATTTGTSPLTIADLGRVFTVADTTNGVSLGYLSRPQVVDGFGSTTLTSARPYWYYLTGGTTVVAFPVSSVSLTVNYFKVGPDLSSGSDVPLMPDRFRYAIVEYATAAALRDVSNYAEAQAASQAGDVIVSRMREWDLLQQGAANSQTITGEAGDW